MTNKRGRRRGMQLLEVMLVLPMIGLVLTAVALSVAGTQGSLEAVQQQSLELATVDRLAQQLREDVHRAVRVPLASGQELEIERLEGVVRYYPANDHLVRRIETSEGRSQATFGVTVDDAPWTVASDEGVVRFAWNGGDGPKEILAAWTRALEESVDASGEETP